MTTEPMLTNCCEDPLFEKACLVARMTGTLGVPMLQRHLDVDYPRAARLMGAMMSAGLVEQYLAPNQGVGYRLVECSEPATTQGQAAARPGLARIVYEKFLNGDKLSDDELGEGLAFFRSLAASLQSLGPVFHLAAKEANRVYLQLHGFWCARQKGAMAQSADPADRRDALHVVLCPGCAAELPLENQGCPHCGYENNEDGRLLTVAELLARPGYPSAGAMRLNDVSPAFLRAWTDLIQRA